MPAAAHAPEVMLAGESFTPDRIRELVRLGWWFELKFDGVRAVVSRTATGDVRITNRSGADITHRYPDVVAHVRDEESFVGVLDGEIVVYVNGRPEFSAIHLRDAQSRAARINVLTRTHPATFMPFDVLERDGRDMRDTAYAMRRQVLPLMYSNVSPASPEGAAMWEFVQEHHLEGLMAKRPDSRYSGRRSPAWVKIKSTKRVSALVGAIVPGKNSTRDVGALELYLFDPANRALRGIGTVGSGMRDVDMRLLAQRMADKLPTVVDVEYLEVSPSGMLRQPVFRGIRQDVSPDACTVDTLIT